MERLDIGWSRSVRGAWLALLVGCLRGRPGGQGAGLPRRLDRVEQRAACLRHQHRPGRAPWRHRQRVDPLAAPEGVGLRHRGQAELGPRRAEDRAGPLPGRRVRISAWLKAADLDGQAGLSVWVLGSKPIPGGVQLLAFDDMLDRPLRAATDWVRLETVVDVPKDSASMTPTEPGCAEMASCGRTTS